MTRRKWCPLTTDNACNGDCQWRIGDNCAMVVLARAAVAKACNGCEQGDAPNGCEGCANEPAFINLYDTDMGAPGDPR